MQRRERRGQCCGFLRWMVAETERLEAVREQGPRKRRSSAHHCICTTLLGLCSKACSCSYMARTKLLVHIMMAHYRGRLDVCGSGNSGNSGSQTMGWWEWSGVEWSDEQQTDSSRVNNRSSSSSRDKKERERRTKAMTMMSLLSLREYTPSSLCFGCCNLYVCCTASEHTRYAS
ncbi:hypothetical protein BC939DRAFT_87117 [Gamsiella multidivaricata]|uniref:uncharacterized protein n=1 Tax=Gamsiella multidivaricata TaxID=101098 RepID=UPI002220FEFC|nr:uncharacterized protein BC939DRAFT_87117 [Gamsiella multidivaricata]KAI7827687.1 hypothetical protein BC939DRAFT_87117 [Gamsiella multidivaricata]